jgi:hypothetical protein
MILAMQDKVSLQKIIEIVLEDKGVEYEKSNDSNVRSIRRAFDRLIERLGSDKEFLKNRGRNIKFCKEEVSFMKVIIGQLYDHRGLVAKFSEKHIKNKEFSSSDVHELIQSLLDEAGKSGVNEDELIQMAKFFSNIFSWSLLRSIEYCHKLIDVLVWNLRDFPSNIQSEHLRKIEYILKKEIAFQIVETIIYIREIAEMIEMSKEVADNKIGIQDYSEFAPEIRVEYTERDKRVLEKIQEDDDLRHYVEKKIGEKSRGNF